MLINIESPSNTSIANLQGISNLDQCQNSSYFTRSMDSNRSFLQNELKGVIDKNLQTKDFLKKIVK